MVICCKHGGASRAPTEMRQMIERLKLQVNEEKSHICHIGERSFNFLGYTLGL